MALSERELRVHVVSVGWIRSGTGPVVVAPPAIASGLQRLGCLVVCPLLKLSLWNYTYRLSRCSSLLPVTVLSAVVGACRSSWSLAVITYHCSSNNLSLLSDKLSFISAAVQPTPASPASPG